MNREFKRGAQATFWTFVMFVSVGAVGAGLATDPEVNAGLAYLAGLVLGAIGLLFLIALWKGE